MYIKFATLIIEIIGVLQSTNVSICEAELIDELIDNSVVCRCFYKGPSVTSYEASKTMSFPACWASLFYEQQEYLMLAPCIDMVKISGLWAWLLGLLDIQRLNSLSLSHL